jgi:hypothetical protein
MVQRELEFASVGVSGNTLNGGPIHAHRTQALLGPGAGSHSAASSSGEEGRVRPVRPVRHPANPLLPLAEGVLRERAAAFANTGKRRKTVAEAKDRKSAALEQKLQPKNEVLAEVMQEYVQLKKELGEP